MIEDTMYYVKFHDLTVIGRPTNFQNSNVRVGEDTIIEEGTIIFSNTTILYDVHIGKNCRIGNFSLIRDNVTLGNDVSIGSHNSIEPYATIGKGTRTQGHCMISEFSSIGENVFLGPYFNTTGDNTIGAVKGEYNANPAKIGNNCRFGTGTKVVPGIDIKDGTITGAMTLLTKDTEKDSLYIGIPGKKVRQLKEDLII